MEKSVKKKIKRDNFDKNRIHKRKPERENNCTETKSHRVKRDAKERNRCVCVCVRERERETYSIQDEHSKTKKGMREKEK